MPNDHQLMDLYLNLTRRQRDVLQLTSDGYSNPEIAEILCVEPCVIAGHLTNIYGEMSTLETLTTEWRSKRYTLIRLFSVFFERHPELRRKYK